MACNNCYLSQILKPTAYSLNDDSHHDDDTKNNDNTNDVEGRSHLNTRYYIPKRLIRYTYLNTPTCSEYNSSKSNCMNVCERSVST